MRVSDSIVAIVPHWRGTPLLVRCLQSLSQQDDPPNETIVVNNGNNIEVEEVASSWGARVIRSGRNLGFGQAVNAAVHDSKAELLLVLNDDAFALPGTVAEIRRAASAFPSAAAFAMRVLDEALATLQSAGLCFTRAGYGNRSGRDRLHQVSEPTVVFGPCGAAALYRRGPFLQAGGFNPAFFLMCEDLELAIRLNVLGCHTLFLPRATFGHRHRGSEAPFGSVVVEQLVANSISTMVTSLPRSFWSRYLTTSILPFYSRGLFLLTAMGYGIGVIRGLGRVLLRIPSNICRRRQLTRQAPQAHDIETLLFDGPLEINLGSRTVSLTLDGRIVS